MSVLLKLPRITSRFPKRLFNHNYCTVVEHPKRSKGLLKIAAIGAGIGAVTGLGYSWYQIENLRKNVSLEGAEIEQQQIKFKPPVPPSRRVVYPSDNTGLQLTLYQYQTCPFCCKVRAFLDYYGISYDVVEVNPLFRKEIGWSSYKKVPILLAKTKEGYQPLNDSSMIVSVLASYLYDSSREINELAEYYPNIGVPDDKGKTKQEVLNKYFLMYNKDIPDKKALNDLVEERKWREWADNVFVHVLSPNIYRTLSESYKTFNLLSKVGHWEEYYPAWQRILALNVGSLSMWLISKGLKKRHNLQNDVRESLYKALNTWLNEIRARGGTFMGGDKPDLSDLAVYGMLRGIEGCDAFKDALENTDLESWYSPMSKAVESQAGSNYLSS